jgi:hypothetical protein
MKVSQLRKLIRETIEEVAIDEMAGVVGMGNAIKITEKGKQALKQMKATNEMSAGLKKSGLKMLAWIFKKNEAGERAQVADYAEMVFGDRKAQPRVNPIFGELKNLGFAEKEQYVSALKGTTSSTPKATPNVADILGDLNFEDDDMGI